LDQWGYPYVLDEYRFHMTLTGALLETCGIRFREALEHAFAERSNDSLELDAISVMRQDDAGARFRVLRRCPAARVIELFGRRGPGRLSCGSDAPHNHMKLLIYCRVGGFVRSRNSGGLE
jgi:hypothetical protein